MNICGNQILKSWATNQAEAAASGEAELYALVKAACVSIAAQALSNDLGIVFTGAIELNPEASAAVRISNRIGSGKVRQIEVIQLWRHEKVRQKVVVLSKVGVDENLAD